MTDERTDGDQIPTFCEAAETAQMMGSVAEAVDRLEKLGVGDKAIENNDTGELLNACASEIERLRAIVDKLPKTADGVAVIVHDGQVVYVFTTLQGLFRPGQKASWHELVVRGFDGTRLEGFVAGSHIDAFFPEQCYSTQKAAESAKEAK